MRLPTSNRLAAAAAVVAAASGSIAFCGASAQAAAAQAGPTGLAGQESCGTSATEYPGTRYGAVNEAESFTFEHGGVLSLTSAAGPDLARASGRYTVGPEGVTMTFEGERTTSAFRGCDTGTTPDVLIFPVDYSGLILVKEPGPPPPQLPTSVLGEVDPDQSPIMQ